MCQFGSMLCCALAQRSIAAASPGSALLRRRRLRHALPSPRIALLCLRIACRCFAKLCLCSTLVCFAVAPQRRLGQAMPLLVRAIQSYGRVLLRRAAAQPRIAVLPQRFPSRFPRVALRIRAIALLHIPIALRCRCSAMLRRRIARPSIAAAMPSRGQLCRRIAPLCSALPSHGWAVRISALP